MRPDPFAPPRDGAPTLLLVDDEPDILVALQDLLEDEFRILSTTEPEHALTLLAEDPEIAVIVSDQRMPGMNGDVFLARARAVSAAEALLLTGYADVSAVVAALNEGRISGYVHKPWEPAALQAMIRQAAERARLSASLRSERLLLRGLLDSVQSGLSVKDLEGRFIRLNAVAAGRLGQSVAACLGRTESDLLPAPAAAEIARDDRLALQPEAAGAAVLREVETEDGVRWFERLREPLTDEDGTVRALVTLERDVTHRRQMEERLRRAERIQALGTMAGGVAHDFNNLLTAILGSLELAQRVASEDPRQTRLLGTARAAAERGAALTRRLLGFSRQRDAALQPVEVNALMTGLSDLLMRGVNRDDVALDYALAPSLPPVLVDPDQFELALLNLCVNARDAMPDGGTIRLSTRLAVPAGNDPDMLLPPIGGGLHGVVGVQDGGGGMTEAVKARIFEPFFTTKDRDHGTGLGLSMIYGFVQQCRGGVRLVSAPDAGTLFELYLPVAASPDAEDEAVRNK